MRLPKYRNRKVTYGSKTFDSQKELERYMVLLDMQKKGLIKDLKLQVPFVLAPSVKLSGKNKPSLRYVADFSYVMVLGEALVVEDVKSPVTAKLAAYRIKKHLMMSVHGIEVKEV